MWFLQLNLKRWLHTTTSIPNLIREEHWIKEHTEFEDLKTLPEFLSYTL